MDYRRTYRSAAVTLVDLVSRVPTWEGPGLGTWSLRDLVGHTVSSALRQVPEVLGRPAESVAVEEAAGYFAVARRVPPEVLAAATAASEADARETGLLLGADPADFVRGAAGRATQALAAVGDDDLVMTPVGGMRVREWLPTRTFELVVHGLDVAGAAGVAAGFEPEAVAEAAGVAARVAALVGDGEVVLRALTGRGTLPPGFSVV